MSRRTTRTRNRFPWGTVALVGLGAWLLYEHSQASTTPALPPTTTPGTLPPTTTVPTDLPVSTATPAQLPAPTLTAQQIVEQAAQTIGTPAWIAFAQTGDPNDILIMANIIQGEWAEYGRCHTTTCSLQWGAIANKYNL